MIFCLIIKLSLFFSLSDHESCRFVPPPHCEIKTISKKLHTLQHNAVKSMLAIEYWCARKQEQDCASEVKDVVRLLDHELGNCLTGLENIVKVVNTLEEENKRLRQDLEQKKKIISDLSFEDIQQIEENEQVQNMTTTMTTGTENTEQKIILNDINEKQHTSQN